MKHELLELDSEIPNFLQHGNILTPSSIRLLCNASEVLEAARAASLQRAHEAEEAFQAEKQRGYEEGLEASKRAAALHQLDTVLSTLDYFEKIQQQLISVLIQSLRTLVQDLPPQERFYQLVARAVQDLKQQSRFVLYVHRSDREAAMTAINRLNEVLLARGGAQITVVAQDNLSPGTALLETPLGRVDASLESQLQVIENSLRKIL